MKRSALALALGLIVCGGALADDRATCNNASGEPALAACTRAIASGQFAGEDLAKLLTSRGVEWKRKGDLDAASADYARAIALNPKDLFAFNNRANILRDKGRLDEAIADYGRAIAIDPDYTAAYINRGLVHEKRGAKPLARADFEAALKTPDSKYPNSRGGKEIARQRLAALAGGRP